MVMVWGFSTVGAALVATSAAAQPQARPPQAAAAPAAADQDEEDIVVTGKPPRGSVVGDIPPVNVLDSHDVKATGASSFDELLEAIAPDIGVARGSGSARPLVLLNGRRVSSYRELRDIPIEAVSRVDILPDEVALKYGYPPDQKVVNVVLQNRFTETVAQVAANTATESGFSGGGADLTRILLTPKRRTTFNLHGGTEDILRGAQRSLVEQQYESSGTGATGLLLPPELGVRGTLTVSRELPGEVEETFNAQAAHSNGHLLSGLSEQLPAELRRHTLDDSLHLGSTLSGGQGKWYWNLAANGDAERNRTTTTDLGQLFAPGNAQSTRFAGDLDGTLNGPLFTSPLGDADVTLRAATSAEYLDIDEQHFASTLDRTRRTTATAAASIDLPISHRRRAFSALGNLTVNGNAEVNQLSDFGTLTRVGTGANWSPFATLNLVGSWEHEERAPRVRQLGDPFVETPGTRMFDFDNGVVNRIALVTGGNPDLRTSKRDTLDLSAEWQPLQNVNFRLRGDYAHVTIDRPISNITVFPTIEQAFPGRFVRDASGRLVSVDLRPVNFTSAHRDTVLLGFDFTRPLKSHKVTNSEVQLAVDKARAAGIAVPQTAAATPNAAPGSLANAATNGRLTFSLTDTITLVDRALIAPGLPQLDYLHGAPVGQTGGQPRHQIQAQAGWSNNGFGARLGANWRSATTVDTVTGAPLHFSPRATFDLRLFANVGQYLPIVSRHPWLRGVSMRFEVGNIFDNRPRVHGTGGAVPTGFETSMLDPLGRTIMFSLRKQFLPASFYRQQLQKFQQQQAQ
ncbi:MAG: TonB-dependent receptor plug domain-containing protein [Sphingomonas sp.]|nr:TonB-dependent receptor plug domain-containing protein [Sphingomonas sp.]